MGKGTTPWSTGLMAGINLEVRSEGLTQMMSLLDPKSFQRAVRAGGRQAGSTARTQAGKEIRARYNITSARIKEDITVGRATPDGVEIVFSRKSPPTIRAYGATFSTTGTSSGSTGSTSWQIFRGQRVTSRNVFWRRAKNSGRILPFVSSSSGLSGPFFPKGAAHGIRVMYGPSIGSIFGGDGRYSAEIWSKVQDATLLAFGKGVEKDLARAARGF
jgi:hypothetical protein